MNKSKNTIPAILLLFIAVNGFIGTTITGVASLTTGSIVVETRPLDYGGWMQPSSLKLEVNGTHLNV